MVEVSTRTISIQHITIVSNKSFDDTRAAFENTLGRLDENVFVLLRYGQVERALARSARLATCPCRNIADPIAPTPVRVCRGQVRR